jgi:hypothetical protein
MTFNYQALDRDSFLARSFIAFVQGVEEWPSNKKVEQLSADTDKFTRVELTISINGHNVNPEKFIEFVDRSIDHRADQKAHALVDEPLSAVMPDLELLQETISNAQQAVRAEVIKRLRSAGVEFNLEDYDV